MNCEANLCNEEGVKTFADMGWECGVECGVCNKKRQAVKPGVYCVMKVF